MARRKATLALLLLSLAALAAAGESELDGESAVEKKPGSSAGEGAPADEQAGKGTIRGKNVWETFRRGGPLMYPILFCSLVGMAFAIERLVSLRRAAVAPRGFADALADTLADGGAEAGLRLCEERPSSLARVLKAGLGLAGSPREEIVTAMEEAGERELWSLERFAKPLSIIAGISPLLGLLGTVWGMIMAFDVVASKGELGNPRELAEGIATALLTTFAGLSVAIPCYLLYHYFSSKSDRLVIEIEETASHMAATLQEAPRHAHPPPPGGGGEPAADAAH